MDDGCTIAVLDITEVEEGIYEINRINVPPMHRGKGYGSKLLQMVMDDADKHMMVLRLSILPSGPLGYMELVAWYRRHGFEFIGQYMYREFRWITT